MKLLAAAKEPKTDFAPIAIVGIACRFAGVANPASLWEAVMSGRSCLTEPGRDLELPHGQRNVFGRPYPPSVGQLGDLYSCVPAMQNFPRQVNAGENQNLYFATQLAFDALTDASLARLIHSQAPVRGSVRVGYAPPFNASTMNWLQHTVFLDQTMEIIHRFFANAPEEAMEAVRAKLVESLPMPDASSFLLGTGYRFASWIARECAFAGAATIMDAGMLTGAATLADAASDLLSGRADVALAGALTPPFSRAELEGLAGGLAFSARPELHPFAKDPDGTLPGEGGAFFVLKRRADALRDHDRIYALLRAIEIGHSPEEQPEQVFQAALTRAKIPVRSIGLIEADGSGVKAMEERELAAIARLWGEHKPGGALVGVGSVKGTVGHTLRAAMAAGVAKTALALWHRVLPPQVAPQVPNEALSTPSSSAYLLTQPRPWVTGNSSDPRRAVVLGANFDSNGKSGPKAGRCAAILLEEEPENRT